MRKCGSMDLVQISQKGSVVTGTVMQVMICLEGPQIAMGNITR